MYPIMIIKIKMSSKDGSEIILYFYFALNTIIFSQRTENEQLSYSI